MGKYPEVLLSSLRGGIKDLTIPYVRTLVDAAQGWVGQHIHLAMQSTRPSLAGAVRITDGLRYHVGAKFDGGSAHRMVAVPRGGARPSLDRGARRSVLRERSRRIRRIFGRG